MIKKRVALFGTSADTVRNRLENISFQPIIKAGGFIMFTVPLRDNHTLSEANLIDRDAEKWIIKDSFYGQRNGQIIQTVSSREKLDELLIDLDIRDPRVCEWKVDWWGTLEHSYIVVGRKKE